MPSEPIRVLFVCLGNICRSPLAEAVFRHEVRSGGWTTASRSTWRGHRDTTTAPRPTGGAPRRRAAGGSSGEPEPILAFLGNDRLVEPIDRFEAAVAFHGHAHHGTFAGRTPGGVPVFNVSMVRVRGGHGRRAVLRPRDRARQHARRVLEVPLPPIYGPTADERGGF